MFKWFKASVPASIIIVFWGILSWTVLPFQMSTLETFDNEPLVAQTLTQNIDKAGVYILPAADSEMKPGKPFIFASILPTGFDRGMGSMVLASIIGNTLAAMLLCYILSKTTLHTYKEKVNFITVVGVFAAICATFPAWNWFGFSALYSLVLFIDIVITWFLAGLVIAAIYHK